MGHEHHVLDGVTPWPAGVTVILLVCAVGLGLWFIHRRTLASDGLTPVERKTLPHPHREILSMLRQHGGFMLQSEIAGAMPERLEEVAAALKGLEERTFIGREWDSEKSTYRITAN
jgi:hypothetical protein